MRKKEEGLIFIEDGNIGKCYWLLNQYRYIETAANMIVSKKVTIVFHNKYASCLIGKCKKNKEIFEILLYHDGEVIKRDACFELEDVLKHLKIYWQYSQEKETIDKLVEIFNLKKDKL